MPENITSGSHSESSALGKGLVHQGVLPEQLDITPVMVHAIDFLSYPEPFRSGIKHPIQLLEEICVSII
jgi:hypothetical protein